MTSDMYERNLRAMREYQPHVAQRLEAAGEPYSRVVGSKYTGDLNIDLGHTRFYAPDAVAYTDRQIEAFLGDEVQRVSLGWPKPHSDRTLLSAQVMGRCTDYLASRGLERQQRQVDSDGGYLLVFGLGLGLHLEPLIDQLDVRSVIVIEQFDEFLHHAMHLVDFEKIFSTIDRRKGTVQFAISDVPVNIANFVLYLMRQDAFGLIDGSYVYTHYNSYVLNETRAYFLERLPVLSANPGFFEDELVMMRNCVANLTTPGYALFNDRPRAAKRTPVIICGSGPSIDRSIDFIREHRDQAVVMSCGTGLGALLGYGIVPDFHVETENTPGPSEILGDLAAKYDLGAVTLIAGNTVRPNTVQAFGHRILYFRDTVCSSKLLGQKYGEIFYTAPTVANAAARISLGLGFRELYLVGVDFGARDAARHHSAQSIYFADPDFLESHPAHRQAAQYTLTAPGNFGGEVRTNHSFLFASIHFSGLLSQYRGARIFNCSDGIRIVGAVPRLPEAAAIETEPAVKGRELSLLDAEVDAADPAIVVSRDDLDAFSEALEIFYLALRSVLNAVDGDAVDLRDLFDELKDLLDDPLAPAPDRAVQQMHVGTLMTCYNFLYQVYRRLPPDERSGFFEEFRGALLAAVDEMEQQSGALAQDLLAAA